LWGEEMKNDMRPTIRGICLEIETLGAAYIFGGLTSVGIVLMIFALVRFVAGVYVSIKCSPSETAAGGKSI
jgi:hypothetical protein